jgi:hypothetical protein
MTPVWMVEKKNESGWMAVPFNWIYPHREDLKAVGLVFATNSYRVFNDGAFSINGGLRLLPSIEGLKDSQIVCVERHAKTLSLSDGKTEAEETSYLLGLQGGEAEIYLHVSPDGKEFRWLNSR